MIIRESVRKMEDIKYFNKQILIEYNNAAIREKRNRAIEEQFLESLQEGVLYPIVFKMYHTKDEIRVQIDFFENRTAFLDMTVERYEMLPVAKWNNENQMLEVEDDEEIRKRFPYKNREWTEKVVKKPYRKQGKFRKDVLNAYDRTCAICGMHESKILRAAHIVPVAKGGIDDITNGICLCTNHEVAFDKGLIKIRPNGKVEVKSTELKGVYDKILLPKEKKNWPSKKYLQEKYDMT